MAIKTIRVADKPTLDEIKSATDNVISTIGNADDTVDSSNKTIMSRLNKLINDSDLIGSSIKELDTIFNNSLDDIAIVIPDDINILYEKSNIKVTSYSGVTVGKVYCPVAMILNGYYKNSETGYTGDKYKISLLIDGSIVLDQVQQGGTNLEKPFKVFLSPGTHEILLKPTGDNFSGITCEYIKFKGIKTIINADRIVEITG